MGPKIKNASHNPAPIPTADLTGSRRPSRGAGREERFESVLSRQQDPVNRPLPKEINSLHREIQALQMAIPIARPGGAISFALQSPKVTQGERLSAASAVATLGSHVPSSQLARIGSSLMDVLRSNPQTAGEGASRNAPSSGAPVRGIHPGSRIGSLSARFESGGDGVDTIGYDDQGGTSYGTFQISSRAGTMRLFVDFLKDHAPDWARRLDAAGPFNTGGRGGAVPREWKRIAQEDPQRFARLQQDFIAETHYLPALQEIQERTGVDIQSQSEALREVLWSTAVQHGPRGAARIFSRAISGGRSGSTDGNFDRNLIQRVYSARGSQFSSSSPAVASAVRRRFEEEKELALGILRSEGNSRSFKA